MCDLDKTAGLEQRFISIPVLPTLLRDIFAQADKWGDGSKGGRINPFIEIYNVGILWHCAFSWASVLSLGF